jgi:hypothetical protein
MAILEDNAAEFGISSPGTDYNEEIYAPVRLSNSTRRRLTPTEQAQQNVNMYSPSGRMMREQEDFELSPEKAAEGELDDGMTRLLTERVAMSLEELSHASELLPLIQNSSLRPWIEKRLNARIAALEEVAKDPKRALKKQEATTLFSRFVGFFQ